MAKPHAPQQVVNERTNRVVLTDLNKAQGIWGSFMGLMFKQSIPDGFGLLFQPAKGIHSQFMRFPIDLVFLDKTNRVTKIREAMRPWRLDFTNAAGVIEMNPGVVRIMDIQAGDQLRFEPTGPGTGTAAR